MSQEQPPMATIMPGQSALIPVPHPSHAVIGREGGYAVSLSPNPMDRQSDFWTSLPETKDSARPLILKAMSSQVTRGSSMIGKPFAVTDCVCHPVELEDEKTGEISTEIRMVLIGPEGEMVGFVSRGAFKALGLVCRLYGAMPWSPAKMILVTQYDTRKGRRSYNIEVVESKPPTPHTGRRRD